MDIFSDTTIEAFWSKVDKRADDECWPWLGKTMYKGYGLFSIKEKWHRAHRYSLAAQAKYWPQKNILACHRCDNPACVNPGHLYWGTNSQNIKEAHERNLEYRGNAGGYNTPLNAWEKDYLGYLFRSGLSAARCAAWFGCAESTARKYRSSF